MSRHSKVIAQTDRHTQMDRQKDRQTNRQTHTHTHKHTQYMQAVKIKYPICTRGKN